MSVLIRNMEMPKNCSDCDFESYPRGAHYCQLEMRAIESLGRPNWCPLEEAKPKHGRWIPCSEKLPKVAGWYFCTVDAEHRSVRELNYAPNPYYDKDKNTWRNPQGRYLFNQLILAWMPLPDPYRELEE